MAWQLTKLPYSYDALEPFYDARTLEIHHDKHHQTYTDKLNDALKGHPFSEKPIEWVLIHIKEVPENIRQAVINHGGGYANHNLFWEILAPAGQKGPEGELLEAIKRDFGSFETMKEKLSATSLNHFGSGWGWLVVGKDKKLEIMATSNQVSPLSDGKTPLMVIDVWEHAYYLKYQNRRAEFVKEIWNILNWKQIAANFSKAMSS